MDQILKIKKKNTPKWSPHSVTIAHRDDFLRRNQIQLKFNFSTLTHSHRMLCVYVCATKCD